MNFINKIVATFFFTGLSPYAPGTAGTIGAAILYAILWQLHFASFPILLLCLIVSSIGNILIGNWAEKYFKTKDPKQVVIDEVAGYFVTILLFKPSITVLLIGFILFRFFDILKPYPIKKFETLPAGTGILVDDLIAGAYSLIILILTSFVASLYSMNLGIVPSLWNW